MPYDKGTIIEIKGAGKFPYPTYEDSISATELKLWSENDYEMYRQKREFIKNLYRKWKKKTFELELSYKLMKYYTDRIDKAYNKEFGSSGRGYLLSPGDRKALAQEMALEIFWELQNDYYDDNLLKS